MLCTESLVTGVIGFSDTRGPDLALHATLLRIADK